MTTVNDHCRTLLAAIIPARRDLLDRALSHLSPAHFPDSTLCNIFRMLERYSEVTGSIITREALGDLVRRTPGGTVDKVLLYEETFDYLHDMQADEAAFRWALGQIRELAAERATGEALTQGMEILTRGVDDRDEKLFGHADARSHILQSFAEIDRELSMQEAPEGDMGKEGEQILAEYAATEAARNAGRSRGIMFGIPALDDKTNGLGPGDLVELVGYTNEGKTHLAVQLAWHASVVQGKNVVFFTTETIRSTVRRRLIARHSCMEHFGLPRGLNSRDIKNGTLTAEEKTALAEVIRDSDKNAAYGKRYIAQVPHGATVNQMESKLARYQRMFHVDLVIIDSLYLLKPEKRRNTDREELSSILKAAKIMATTFNDGLGVPLVSPWQVSRAARNEAERTGFYTSQALSETAEAANSADLIISLLAPMDNESREAAIKLQLMKNRDGERANSIQVQIDYALSKVYSRAGGPSQMDDLWDGPDVFGL